MGRSKWFQIVLAKIILNANFYSITLIIDVQFMFYKYFIIINNMFELGIC